MKWAVKVCVIRCRSHQELREGFQCVCLRAAGVLDSITCTGMRTSRNSQVFNANKWLCLGKLNVYQHFSSSSCHRKKGVYFSVRNLYLKNNGVEHFTGIIFSTCTHYPPVFYHYCFFFTSFTNTLFFFNCVTNKSQCVSDNYKGYLFIVYPEN